MNKNTSIKTPTQMNINDLLKMSYPEQIKYFNKINVDEIMAYIQQKGKTINKQLHPILLYNYPLLINTIMDNTPNGVNDANLKYSPTAIDAILKSDNHNYKELLINQKENAHESIDFLLLHKNVHNKCYADEVIYDYLVHQECSNRRINEFAKVYPCLYDNPVIDTDAYKQSVAYMAIEHKNVEFIAANIDYYKNMFKTPTKANIEYVDKLIHIYPYAVIDEVFDANMYTDTPLLANIDMQPLAKYTKDVNNLYRFWIHHNNTKHTCIDTLEKLHMCIKLKLDADSISNDILDEYGLLVLNHFPYMYYYYSTNNKTVKGIKPQCLYELVLDDPYNIVYLPKDEFCVQAWLKASNNKLHDAWLAIDYLILNDINAVGDIKRILMNHVSEFTDKFTALSTYPILARFLNKNLVTPYIYNLMVQLDKDMFNELPLNN